MSALTAPGNKIVGGQYAQDPITIEAKSNDLQKTASAFHNRSNSHLSNKPVATFSKNTDTCRSSTCSK